MKLFTKLVLLSLSATAVLLTSCLEFDSDYGIGKLDGGDIQIGSKIEAPLATVRVSVEDVLDISDILQSNGLPGDSWDDLPDGYELDNVPTLFTTPSMDMDFDIGKDMIDALTGEGELFLYVEGASTLPFDVMLEIVFKDDVEERYRSEEIEVNGSSGANGGETKITISAHDLEAISNSNMVEVTFTRDNTDKVILDRNMNMHLKLSVEKTGGINLGDITGGDDDEDDK